MLSFTVDDVRCTRCGWCVRDCPAGIIVKPDDGVPRIPPEKEGNCMECQHCLAVCPSGAVSILGFDPDQSLALSPESFPSLEKMEHLVRGRRSVRHYREENVPRELVDRLMTDLSNAPTGVNARELTFILVDDREVMRRFQERAMSSLSAALPNIPGRYSFLREMVAGDPDVAARMIFRGAPHALVVSASPDAFCATEDVPLCLAYFELLAQSAGLGTVWWGFLKVVLEAAPELKQLLGLPAGHVYYAMLFGKPAVRYYRTVQRDRAARIRRVDLS